MAWRVAGLGRKVHQDQLETGLPEDLYRDFHHLSEWAQRLPEKFGSRVSVRLVDAVSLEGFFKSLIRRVGRYPAFTVGGERYEGRDFSAVDALIAARIARRVKGACG